MVGVSIYNISSTSCWVSWPPAPGCLDTFYSVLYDPNWSSLLMVYTRRSFMHEERIPASHTATRLSNLAPLTTYFLCVTCQAANPTREQCRVFSTLGDSTDAAEGVGWELAVGVWMASSLLLLVIAGVLLWSCLYTVCPVRPRRSGSSLAHQHHHHAGASGSDCLYTPSSSSSSNSCCDGDAKRAVVQKPLHLLQTDDGHVIAQGQLSRSPAKPPDPV